MFSTHPVHCEAVASVVGRAEILAATFFMLSFLAFVQGAQAGSTSWVWMFASCGMAIAATLSKETGITVLGVCVVYDWLFMCSPSGVESSRSSAHASTRSTPIPTITARLKSTACRSACCAAMLLLVLKGRSIITGGTFGPTFSNVDNVKSMAALCSLN